MLDAITVNLYWEEADVSGLWYLVFSPDTEAPFPTPDLGDLAPPAGCSTRMMRSNGGLGSDTDTPESRNRSK